MIVGNPAVFAIESEITRAYEQLSFRALGFFVIHVKARSYGRKEQDATLLACSLDEVGARVARRGSHIPSFSIDADAGEIAVAVRRTLYTDCESGEHFFGMPAPEFAESIHASHLLWAPDGDEAFDDGSYVLQFEDRDWVRLVGFCSTEDSLLDPASLRDVRLTVEEFYGILQKWHDTFIDEWKSLPKFTEDIA
jgi:hypothetical protein